MYLSFRGSANACFSGRFELGLEFTAMKIYLSSLKIESISVLAKDSLLKAYLLFISKISFFLDSSCKVTKKKDTTESRLSN